MFYSFLLSECHPPPTSDRSSEARAVPGDGKVLVGIDSLASLRMAVQRACCRRYSSILVLLVLFLLHVECMAPFIMRPFAMVTSAAEPQLTARLSLHSRSLHGCMALQLTVRIRVHGHARIAFARFSYSLLSLFHY
jgi:hypothetical protein